MYKTNLRKVGGSVMLALPPALLDILRLRPGAQVRLSIESGRLIVEPQQRPHYTLEELLARCKTRKARTREDREWAGGGPAGSELI